MSRRPPRQQVGTGWVANLAMNAGVAPIATAAFFLVGWYFLTSDTMKRHDAQFETINKRDDQDKDERRKTRDEFMAGQQKNNEILAKLDTRLAVSETKQEVANQTLAKIADELSRLNARAGAGDGPRR